MIEVVYKEESRESKENAEVFHVPRNIRQIGLSGGKIRIYVEDYVYTFMNRLAEKAEGENGGLAVLVGKAEWNEGITYVFVKGAIHFEEQVNLEHISMGNEGWQKVQEAGEKYFSDLDVVGWFLTIPQMTMEINEIIGKMHLKYFSGGEKILMMMEPLEKDEAFFYYENGRFVKTAGYYLYYEKNRRMQEYMTEHKWWETSENEKVIPDEAVKSFRKKFAKKAEATREEEREKPSVFSYAATACLVLAILVTGANFVKNYQKIQTVGEDLEASAVFTVDDQVEISLTPSASSQESASKNLSELTGLTRDDLESVEINGLEKGEEASTILEKTSESKSSTVNEDVAEESGEEDADVENETGKESSTTVAEAVEGDESAPAETEQNDSVRAGNNEEETSSKSVLTTYMVRPGDTLYQISMLNYGTMDAITEICRMNNISEEEMIYPGQIIVLP